jgi:hypothetical protein
VKKNRVNLLAAGFCVAGLFTGILSAGAQVTLTFNGVSPEEDVTLQAAGAFSFGPEAVQAGIYNQTVNGVPTPSFCIDVFRDAPNTTLTDYNFADLSLSPLAPAGPMGLVAATDIEKLWAAYFPAATANSQDAAALQVAIWEDVAASVGTYTLTFSGNDPVTTEATTMLASLPNLTTQANLVGLVSPSGQNYVVITPAPEPTTTGCLLVGLGVLACFQRLKIGRRI